MTVQAGTSYTFVADQAIYHPGVSNRSSSSGYLLFAKTSLVSKYTAVYMSTASSGAGVETAGSGATWFKIFEDPPVYVDATTGYVFPDETATTVNFTIPKATPSGAKFLVVQNIALLTISHVGDYLIRVEQIALHVASSFGGAQFYLGCAQVTVRMGS